MQLLARAALVRFSKTSYNRTVPLSRADVFARAQAAIEAVRGLPPHAAFAREMRRIRRAEIHGSTALAGSPLEAAEVDALLDQGRAEGGHLLADYVLVRDYATAAGAIADARRRPASDPRLLIDLEELRRMHAQTTAGSDVRGGAWRQGNPVLATGGSGAARSRIRWPSGSPGFSDASRGSCPLKAGMAALRGWPSI